MKYAISDLDIFYISFDEPNAEETYRELSARAPRPIKRVHGVKGFNKAHQRCAELSETRRFVTIDGDNMVDSSLFFQRIDDEGQKDLVFSFKAKNAVNGLEYGNGGVKVWPTNLVLQVPTHEDATDPQAMTDFCWTYRYMQVNHLASTVMMNQSPLQAFRAGYREAFKMSLINGRKEATWADARAQMYAPNLSRLMTWASVGADAENGWWAIYGTRQGLCDLWIKNMDLDVINDYEWFNDYFLNFFDHEPDLAASAMGRIVNRHLGTEIVDLSAQQSRWFKQVYLHPPRQGIMLPDMAPVEFSDD